MVQKHIEYLLKYGTCLRKYTMFTDSSIWWSHIFRQRLYAIFWGDFNIWLGWCDVWMTNQCNMVPPQLQIGLWDHASLTIDMCTISMIYIYISIHLTIDTFNYRYIHYSLDSSILSSFNYRYISILSFILQFIYHSNYSKYRYTYS